MKSLEREELQKFYLNLQQEIKSTLLTEEDGIYSRTIIH